MIKKYLCIAFLSLGSMYAASAFAIGPQVWLQSANSAGDFGAGIAATADDPDTSFYNPAGLPWIQHQDMGFSVLTRTDDTRFEGSEQIQPTITGYQGKGSAQGGRLTYLANLFYAAPLDRQWTVGLSVSHPFFYALNYGEDSTVRYLVTNWKFDVLDVTPSLGFRPLNSVAIGVGLDFQHGKLDFNQVDTDSDVANDANSEAMLSDWGLGWNAGIMWQPSSRTRIGLSHHSAVHYQMSGDSRFATAPNSIRRVRSEFHLPPYTILSMMQTIGERFTLLGTISYTQWSKLGRLTLHGMTSNDGTFNYTVFNQLHNTWLYSLGMHYNITPYWQWKVGVGYQQGGSVAKRPSLAMPSFDQYVFALGLRYKLSYAFRFNLGYDHFFNTRHTIDRSQQTSAGTITSQGRVGTATDVMGVQLNWVMT